MRGIVPRRGADKAALEYPVDTRIASLQPVMRLRMARSSATLTLQDAKEVWKVNAKSAATLAGEAFARDPHTGP
jgi:hypothetical protein